MELRNKVVPSNQKASKEREEKSEGAKKRKNS